MDRAEVVVAVLELGERGARLAAVECGGRGAARALLRAAVARSVAIAPAPPGGHIAVHRARDDVALLRARRRQARHATMRSGNVHSARAALRPATACFGAHRPVAPASKDTVDRALHSVARLRLGQRAATDAAKCRRGRRGASARLHAGAARHGARIPVRPIALDAIHRAVVRVARGDLREVRADLSLVRLHSDDAAGSILGTAATRLRAPSEIRPL
jgi:hypothetical protein